MDNLDTPFVTPAELDSSLKIALQTGPFTALDLANLIWGTSYSTALELPLFTLGAWDSLQTQLIARVRRRLLVLKDNQYYAPGRHEPPTYDPPYLRTQTP